MSPIVAFKAAGMEREPLQAHPKDPWLFWGQVDWSQNTLSGKCHTQCKTENLPFKLWIKIYTSHSACSKVCEILEFFPLLQLVFAGTLLLWLYFGICRWHCADPTEFMGIGEALIGFSQCRASEVIWGNIENQKSCDSFPAFQSWGINGVVAKWPRLSSACAEVNQDVIESRV